MIFYLKHLVVALSVSTFTNGLPLEARQKPRDLAQRAKSYSIVNVDGGSTAALETTAIVDVQTRTETIKITGIAPTVTDTVSVTIEPTPAPAPPPTSKPSSLLSSPTASSTSASSSSSSVNSLSTPTPTPVLSSTPVPKPSVVTVVVTETPSAGLTQYYDNGMWHTSYVIKTLWDNAVVTASP